MSELNSENETARLTIDPHLLTRELRLTTRFIEPIQEGKITKLLLRVAPRWLPYKDELFDFFVRKNEGRYNELVYWRSAICLNDPIPVFITYAKAKPILFYGVDHGISTCQFKLELCNEEADNFAKERGFSDFALLTKFFHTVRNGRTGSIEDLREIVLYDLSFQLTERENNNA